MKNPDSQTNEFYGQNHFVFGCLFEYGICCQQDINVSIREYIKGMRCNNSNSVYRLGILCEPEPGKEHDESCNYYKRANDLGHTSAKIKLGLMYAKGIGCNIDYKKAIEEFKKAHEKENVVASCYLGVIYKDGLYNEQVDTFNADGYFKQATFLSNRNDYKNIIDDWGKNKL